jgi:hypothetical protein
MSEVLTQKSLIEERNRYLGEYKMYLHQAKEGGDMHAAEMAFASAKMAQKLDVALAHHNQKTGLK